MDNNAALLNNLSAFVSYAYDCFTGPTVYQSFHSTEDDEVYEPNHQIPVYTKSIVELIGEYGLWMLRVLIIVATYTSPLTFCLFRKRILNGPNIRRTIHYGVITLACLYLLRGQGRLFNHSYHGFLETLNEAAASGQHQNGSAAMNRLRQYDFEFYAWPVNFIASRENQNPLKYLPPVTVAKPDSWPDWLWTIHGYCSWMLSNTIGKAMIFPPSHLSPFNALLGGMIMRGRRKTVEQFNGTRYKVGRSDGSGHWLDVMFTERRHNLTQFPDGAKLIVTSEGNAGFYEIGSMQGALKTNYSVIGWNYPGFMGSSGTAWPLDVTDGINSVLRFAIDGLGFAESDIIVYGWSIGGYTASWAAMNYPHLGGVILDATFDDVLPLALTKTMKRLGPVYDVYESLVTRLIREDWNLHILDQIVLYDGPITFIRRTREDIIHDDGTCTQCMVVANRCKPLLLGLLKHRYPSVFRDSDAESVLIDFFDDPTNREKLLKLNAVNENQWHHELKDAAEKRLKSAAGEDTKSSLFPIKGLGDNMKFIQRRHLILYLTARYMVDYDALHVPLPPPQILRPPIHPWVPKK